MTPGPRTSPLVFASASIQAIKAGKQRQTRRIVKPQPPPAATLWYCDPAHAERWIAATARPDDATPHRPYRNGWYVPTASQAT